MATLTIVALKLEDFTAAGGCALRAVPLRASLAAAGCAAGLADATDLDSVLTACAGACPCDMYCAIAQPVVPPTVTWYQDMLLLSTTGPFLIVITVPGWMVVNTEPLRLGSDLTRK